MTAAALLAAMILVESGGDPCAVNAAEDAAGVLQIRPVLVADVNRILAAPVFAERDRFCPAASREMWRVYLGHYGRRYERLTGRPMDAEAAARMWCGGPDGWRKAGTDDYWRRVQRAAGTQRR